MTINGVTSAASLGYVPANSRAQAQQPAGDQVAMSLSPETFSSLVSEAGSMPEVRGEVVDAFKSQVQSGNYPSQETLDGLVDLMGSSWVKLAATSSAS
jgi:hypothetical protein